MQTPVDPSAHLSDDAVIKAPEFPKFISELAVVELEKDRLAIVGQREMQVLRAQGLSASLPRIVGLMDGTRTVQEIASAAGTLSEKGVSSLVFSLYTAGAVESGASVAEKSPALALDSYLGRFVDVTRINASRSEGYARLQQCNVHVLAPAELATLAEKLLVESGIPNVTVGIPLSGRRHDLVVAVDGKNLRDAYVSSPELKEMPTLLVRLGERRVCFGPLLGVDGSCCYDCYSKLVSDVNENTHCKEPRFWLSMGVMHASNLLSGIAIPPIWNKAIVHDLLDEGMLGKTEWFAGLPGCERCGIESVTLSEEALQQWLYHRAEDIVPKRLRSRRAQQTHYRKENIEMARDRGLPLFGSKRIVLPDLQAALKGENSLHISKNDLSVVLGIAAGYPSSSAVRPIAPSGGNLKSPEMYVSTEGVTDLENGVYRYDRSSHALELVPYAPSFDVGAEWSGSPRISVAVVSSLERLRAKYFSYGHRVGFIDAGVATRMLYVAAELGGLEILEKPQWSDTAQEGLRLRNASAVVTTIALRRAQRPKMAIQNTGDLDLLLASGQNAAPTSFHVSERSRPSLIQTVFQRRSIREWLDESIDVGTLSRIFSRALGAVRERSASGAPPLGLSLLLAVKDAREERFAGIHLFDGPTRRFFLLRHGLTAEDLSEFVTQEDLARAPYTALVCANVQDALYVRGARGYQEALLQSGSVAMELALQVQSHGLGGVISASISSASAARVSGTDGFRVCPIALVSFGKKR